MLLFKTGKIDYFAILKYIIIKNCKNVIQVKDI